MIVVRVELHSANDGSVTELARCALDNQGGTEDVCDYRIRTFTGRSKAALDRSQKFLPAQRTGLVKGHRRKQLHVWHLVSRALQVVGYGSEK